MIGTACGPNIFQKRVVSHNILTKLAIDGLEVVAFAEEKIASCN